MKKILTIITGVFILGILFTAVSCTEDWEDLNIDPNNPTEVPATNILANTIWYIADGYYDPWFNMNNTSTYSGHLGKIQYIDESRYFEREGVINDNWQIVFQAIKDMKNAKAIAAGMDEQNMVAVAMTMEAFLFQMATDSWRDIPFTDAGKAEDGILNPKYDTQELIYPALLDSLSKANDIFNGGFLDDLGDGDVLFGGTVENWQKFCNSLRLRIANRMYGADAATAATAGAVIEAIFADATTNPVMAVNGDNAFLVWPGVSPYKEPWFDDSEGRDDHAMGSYLIDEMTAISDPRMAVYAVVAESDGAYRGVVPGVSDDDLGPLKEYSRIGKRFRGEAAGFTPFMRCSEVFFIQAEAALNGLSVGLTADAAFNAGVTASLDENGIVDVAWVSGLGAATKAKVYQQKWISLFKNGHEAWAECRRTDYPVMAAAPDARFTGHTRPPFRFPYPQNEVNLNGDNVQTYLDKTTDKFWGQKMWWDKRTGVN